MKLRTLFLASLLAAAPAFAADVDGKWAGSIDTPNGAVPVSYTFKSSGATLTGSTVGPDGAAIAIKDGKIKGNAISFSIDLNFGGTATTVAYTGIVAPAEIKIHTEFMGMPLDFTVKKAG